MQAKLTISRTFLKINFRFDSKAWIHRFYILQTKIKLNFAIYKWVLHVEPAFAQRATARQAIFLTELIFIEKMTKAAASKFEERRRALKV